MPTTAPVIRAASSAPTHLRCRNFGVSDGFSAGHVNLLADRRSGIAEAEEERPWRQACIAQRGDDPSNW